MSVKTEDVQSVLDFMRDVNRPHSVQSCVDAMCGRIKKTACQRALEELTSQGTLIMKEWGKNKIFCIKQDEFPKVSDEELQELDDQLKELTESNTSLTAELKAISVEVSTAQNKMTLDEICDTIRTLKAEIAQQNKMLKTDEKQESISKEDRDKLENQLNEYKKQWRKRRRICNEITDMLCEGMGKRRKELHEELGLEDDESSGVNLDLLK
eukprot:GCRY01003824.1.p1 GENE.GCRY01003824.1~~GCRY01003824.1.p1  ORF type:complete len:211 (+),score=39.84 GCRY01003824.1:93-725(+)